MFIGDRDACIWAVCTHGCLRVFFTRLHHLLKWLWSEDGCNDINNHVNEEVVYDYVLSVVYIRDREDKK